MNEVNTLWSLTSALWSDGAYLSLFASYQKKYPAGVQKPHFTAPRKFLIEYKLNYSSARKGLHSKKYLLAHLEGANISN